MNSRTPERLVALAPIILLFTLTSSAASLERHVLVQRKAPPNPELAEFIRKGWKDLEPQAVAWDRELAEKGFITAPDAVVQQGRDHKVAITTLTARLADIRNLGFVPVVLEGAEVSRASLVGIGGSAPAKDGRVHQIVRKYRHPELGDIFIDEYSFATDPDVTEYAVQKARGNIYIHGDPASVWPMRSPEGSERTNISYYTDSVMYSVDVYRTLPIGSSELAVLEQFVQALH